MATLLQNPDVRAVISSDYLTAVAAMDDATTILTLGLGASLAAAERGEKLTDEQRAELRAAADRLRATATHVAEIAAVVTSSDLLPPAPRSPLGTGA